MTSKAGELAPLGRQREADADKGEADNHVPGADSRNWVLGLGDVESHDPEEPDEEIGDHDRGEPRRALQWCMGFDGVNLLLMGASFLNLLTQFRLWHG